MAAVGEEVEGGPWRRREDLAAVARDGGRGRGRGEGHDRSVALLLTLALEAAELLEVAAVVAVEAGPRREGSGGADPAQESQRAGGGIPRQQLRAPAIDQGPHLSIPRAPVALLRP